VLFRSRYGEDRLLYKYARLYDPTNKSVVPYFELEERVEVEDDGRVVKIKRVEK